MEVTTSKFNSEWSCILGIEMIILTLELILGDASPPISPDGKLFRSNQGFNEVISNEELERNR